MGQDITLSTVELIYMGIVLIAGSILLWRTLVYLGAVREGRLKGVKGRRRFDSTPTSTPLMNPREIATERAEQSIQRHFTVMKRVLVPFIVGLTILLAAIPVLAEGSASAASVIGAVLAVVIGLAARPFLENAIAGIVISASRLVRIGDTVKIDDLYGTVEDITATHTAVKVWDWRRYLVPNSTMLQRAFLNHSLFDTFEWSHVEFWVSPEADIDAVRDIAVLAAEKSGYMASREAPAFWIKSLDRDAACCVVAAWVKTATDSWAHRSYVRERLMRELHQRGIHTSLRHHVVRETHPMTDAETPAANTRTA